LLGDAEMINEEWTKYQAVTVASLKETAAKVLRADNCNTLFYKKKTA
jgi:hypothetical protein